MTNVSDDTCSQMPIRNNGRFAPGVSGNPGGRPATRLADGRSLKDVAREHTGAAVETLVDTMNDPEAAAAARISAAMAILDRGWGKPTQHMETIDLTPLHATTEMERAARLAAIFAAAQARMTAAQIADDDVGKAGDNG